MSELNSLVTSKSNVYQYPFLLLTCALVWNAKQTTVGLITYLLKDIWAVFNLAMQNQEMYPSNTVTQQQRNERNPKFISEDLVKQIALVHHNVYVSL